MTLATEIYNSTINLREKINKNIKDHTRRYAVRMLVIRILLGKVEPSFDLEGIAHLCHLEEASKNDRS